MTLRIVSRISKINQNTKMSDRKERLQAKLEELRQEIQRKDALLKRAQGLNNEVVLTTKNNANQQPVGQHKFESNSLETVIATLTELHNLVKSSRRPEPIDGQEALDGQYEALRSIAGQVSLRLEQEARKIALGWKTTENDAEARNSLIVCIVQPAEGVVTSLVAIGSLSTVIDVLRTTCLQKASDICSSCLALCRGLDSPNVPPLAGAVEAACEEVRKLPNGNKACAVAHIVQAARALNDTRQEFESLAHEGKVDWGFDGDEEDGENGDSADMDEIDSGDSERLINACKVFAACKKLLSTCGASLEEDQIIRTNAICIGVDELLNSATDFGVELYPPHDTPRVIQKASFLLEAASKLNDVLSSANNSSAKDSFEELKSHLSLIVV